MIPRCCYSYIAEGDGLRNTNEILLQLYLLSAPVLCSASTSPCSNCSIQPERRVSVPPLFLLAYVLKSNRTAHSHKFCLSQREFVSHCCKIHANHLPASMIYDNTYTRTERYLHELIDSPNPTKILQAIK